MSEVDSRAAQLKSAEEIYSEKRSQVNNTMSKISAAEKDYLKCILETAVNSERLRRRNNMFFVLFSLAISILLALILLAVNLIACIVFVTAEVVVVFSARLIHTGDRQIKMQQRQEFFIKYRDDMQRLGLKPGFKI